MYSAFNSRLATIVAVVGIALDRATFAVATTDTEMNDQAP